MLGSRVHFADQAYLLHEGDRTDHVFVLLSGLVKVVGEMGDREVLISLRVAGDVVGELGAMTGEPRVAAVMACGEVSARRISGDTWRAFLADHQDASMATNQLLCDRLVAATRRQLDLAGRQSRVRVARVLLELGREFGQRSPQGLEIAVGISQAELASAAGCSESTLRDLIKDFRSAGVLITGYRRYVLVDEKTLLAAADVQ